MNFKSYSKAEKDTWRTLFSNLISCQGELAHPIFAEGLEKLGIGPELPDMDEVNRKLRMLTGWQGAAVTGLDGPEVFFDKLRHKLFPIGNFIREATDLNYTPAPDVFHDLYGHMPFFADQKFADFCLEFGQTACRYLDQPRKLRQFERLFWFGVEFPLVLVDGKKKIFGGGILSSHSECYYSVSDKPDVQPFDLRVIRDQEYRIDVIQNRLFILENPDQLYGCLSKFCEILV